ncbi:hypothetical protein J2W46_002979 [Paraburkholderia strydomiana]|nr:hypothetical protein [Paraburkholderia strydomiana]
MPTLKEIYRENSSTRTICTMLGVKPLTQTQISAATGVTNGCACKCLKLLIEEGYVKRGPRAMSGQRNSLGPRPWTYVTTGKPFPSARTALPEAPSAKELCDIMNQIIRRAW